MFTGLVEELGECQHLERTAGSARLTLRAPHTATGIHTGDSVAVNGCCLTVASHGEGRIAFDLLEETLRCTNLKNLRPGTPVNLERALAATARLGGHFVQGHVDTTARVRAVSASGADLRLDFHPPHAFASHIAHKGSVAINGVSLTVAAITPDSFTVWIIPHTRRHTNLGALAPDDEVNLECDILAKYVERLLAPSREAAQKCAGGGT